MYKLYTDLFLESCLLLFKSNIPIFFDSSEEKLFVKYLTKVNVNYYVFFDEEKNIVASGGYEYDITSEAIALTWGMVGKKFHNQGYGTQLTDYRLNKIKIEFPGNNIILNTTQKTFKFYTKFGFKVIKITNNYYGMGLDRYDMIKMN